jgi:hypothetical protein
MTGVQVLVVEDEFLIGVLIEEALVAGGFEVILAVNGQKAIADRGRCQPLPSTRHRYQDRERAGRLGNRAPRTGARPEYSGRLRQRRQRPRLDRKGRA